MINWIKVHPILSVIISFNIVLLVIVLIIFINQNSKTALLDVIITPIDSNITLNGQKIENFQTQKFTPGQYTAKIEKEGMETKEINLNLEKDTTTKLHAYLTGPNNDFSYYIQNSNDENILEQVSDNNSAPFIKKYSIIKILPLNYEKYINNYSTHVWFKILKGDSECNSQKICLKVSDKTGDNENIAYDLIREKGFDPLDYQIVYKYEPMSNL